MRGIAARLGAAFVLLCVEEVWSIGCAKEEATIQELRARIKELEKQAAELGQPKHVAGSAAGISESEEEQALFAQIQLAKWPFDLNFRQLTKKPTSFYIEVGANNRDTLVDHMEDVFQQGGFLITFEPLLDKYADVLVRFGIRPNRWRGLGLQTHHSMVLPVAVGCGGPGGGGTARFHVTPADGCSSLLQPRGKEFENDPRRAGWNEWMDFTCATEVDTRVVPCVSLEHVIEHWLQGSEVEYLKVDTQGFDLSVVMSAGRHLDKLRSISMEVQCDYVAKLYAGAPNCTHVFTEMTRLGFETAFDPKFCRRCVETEIHFNRPGSRSPLDWLNTPKTPLSEHEF